ncbi:hypothetical protein AURDEDRAFT_110751 [Auricularia subglabra TFB-10046 SS5]|nr:hypothetical protein AURDEDRAFT_110751 [Auricularia subglabra TFB-10046 SS5]
MASSPLQAFDPLAKHYFTSHGTPAPPQPQQPVAFASRVPYGAQHAPAPSSVPSHQTPRPPVKAPQPLHPGAAAAAAKPIFTSFQKDRASPDLPDVKKKSPSSWGASPSRKQ